MLVLCADNTASPSVRASPPMMRGRDRRIQNQNITAIAGASGFCVRPGSGDAGDDDFDKPPGRRENDDVSGKHVHHVEKQIGIQVPKAPAQRRCADRSSSWSESRDLIAA